MTPVVQKVAVIGLGLLGGSIALAAKRHGVAGRVAGATRRRSVLEQALAEGAVDETGEPESVVRGADLVVLATPVFAMADVVRRIAPALEEGAVVTDVGSVKASLADTLPGLLPRGVHYVGSHPMAGSHHRGLDHARADLFEGAACVVMTGTEDAARERVVAFWRALGGRVVLRDALDHDEEVAWMSHVPHVLAFAFAQALEQAPSGAFDVQGPGFRDFTRIAQGDAELWGDILTANRKSIAAPLQAVANGLEAFTRLLESDDAEAAERFIAAARAALAEGGVRGPDPAEPESSTAGWPGGAGE